MGRRVEAARTVFGLAAMTGEAIGLVGMVHSSHEIKNQRKVPAGIVKELDVAASLINGASVTLHDPKSGKSLVEAHFGPNKEFTIIALKHAEEKIEKAGGDIASVEELISETSQPDSTPSDIYDHVRAAENPFKEKIDRLDKKMGDNENRGLVLLMGESATISRFRDRITRNRNKRRENRRRRLSLAS